MVEKGFTTLPKFGYTLSQYDPIVHVRASGREVNVSPKAAREVCAAVKGMKITAARAFLEKVINLKVAVAFRRYKKKVGHRSSLSGFHAGRFPRKTALKVLEVMDNLEANAGFKGLDLDRLVLFHAATHRGMKMKRYVPRAFGRSSPNFRTLVHIELAARER